MCLQALGGEKWFAGWWAEVAEYGFMDGRGVGGCVDEFDAIG